MDANQRKARPLVVLHHLVTRLPTRGGVTLLAGVGKLTAMVVEVAIEALRCCFGKDK